jgi:hypothetical protein
MTQSNVETELIDRLTVSEGRLSITPGPPLRARLTADPWVDYPPTVDLAAVPRSVLLQTAIHLLAPVVWLHDLAVTVTGADTSVVEALPLLRAEIHRMYPMLSWAGTIRVVDPVPVAPLPLPRGDRGRPTGLMLSGGVDSIASAVRHPDGSLLTMTIALDDEADRGPERWARTAAGTAAFAAAHGHEHRLIASNARSMVPASIGKGLGAFRYWWPEVAHGMSLAAMAAPALWSAGAERLLIASSHVPGYDARWGSSAKLDPLIGLGPIVVQNDAYDADRLDKVARIVEAAGPAGSVQLRVCNKAVPDDRLNCGVCEKCLRTQAGLVLSGGDPARFGFPDPAACALALSPAEWDACAGKATRSTIYNWLTMGRAARELDPHTRPPEHRALIAWLATLEAGRPPMGDPTVYPTPRSATRPPVRPSSPAHRVRRWIKRATGRTAGHP